MHPYLIATWVLASLAIVVMVVIVAIIISSDLRKMPASIGACWKIGPSRTLGASRKIGRWICIVCSFPEELKILETIFDVKTCSEFIAGIPIVEGRVSGVSDRISLSMSGISMPNAARGCQFIIDRYGPKNIRAILSVGIAGGLSDRLSIGSVVIPTSWFHHAEQIWVTEGSSVSPIVPMPYITPGYDCLSLRSEKPKDLASENKSMRSSSSASLPLPTPNRFISANFSFKVEIAQLYVFFEINLSHRKPERKDRVDLSTSESETDAGLLPNDRIRSSLPKDRRNWNLWNSVPCRCKLRGISSEKRRF